MPFRTSYLLFAICNVVVNLLLPQGSLYAADTGPQVLFVCEHGAAKSIIAAAHFNKLAKERGLPHRAIARGTQPDVAFAPAAVTGLQSEGFAFSQTKPERVTDKDVSRASHVVTLGCKLPQKAAVTDWNDVPSVSANYPAASRTIREHVAQLVEQIATEKGQAKR